MSSWSRLKCLKVIYEDIFSSSLANKTTYWHLNSYSFSQDFISNFHNDLKMELIGLKVNN